MFPEDQLGAGFVLISCHRSTGVLSPTEGEARCVETESWVNDLLECRDVIIGLLAWRRLSLLPNFPEPSLVGPRVQAKGIGSSLGIILLNPLHFMGKHLVIQSGC